MPVLRKVCVRYSNSWSLPVSNDIQLPSEILIMLQTGIFNNLSELSLAECSYIDGELYFPNGLKRLMLIDAITLMSSFNP